MIKCLSRFTAFLASLLPTMTLLFCYVCTVQQGVTQGYYEVTAVFGNRIPGILDAPIYDKSLRPGGPLTDWENAKSGNTPAGFPAEEQFYRGPLLEGWNIIFFAAPGQVDNARDLLFPSEVILTLGSGADAGYFETTTVKFYFPVTDTKATFGTVQARAWYGRKDPFQWESMLSGNLLGASSLFTVEFGEDKVATGLRSFSVGWLDQNWLPQPVPEPSAIALCFLSGAIFLVARQRKTGKKYSV